MISRTHPRNQLTEVERTVRDRLRALRQTMGWSLDDLAERSHLSASTISRIETGKRSISLDVLLALADAMQVEVDSLLDIRREDDVVIRPTPTNRSDRTTWLLSRPTESTWAMKIRLEQTDDPPKMRVHPGRDWFFVLEGRVGLRLGERQITVEAGEAAEFACMTPHAFHAVDGAAELITLFDRQAHRVHTDHD